MDTIEQKVVECATMAYRKKPGEVTLETNIRKELSQKSLMMIAFISTIENELDVSIPINETGSLITVGDFAEKVKALAE